LLDLDTGFEGGNEFGDLIRIERRGSVTDGALRSLRPSLRPGL
jgi:hypothetical protein